MDSAATRSSPLVLQATFVLMGMSTLAPFNTLVTASEYFRDAFTDVPALASGFNSGLMAVFNATSVVFGVLAALSGSHGNINMTRRSQKTLLLLCAATAILLVSVMVRPIEHVSSPRLYYALLLVMSAVLALGMALFQSATMALCVMLDRTGSFVALVLLGQAMQGVVSSVIGLIGVLFAGSTKADAPQAYQNQRAAFSLFLSTFGLLLLTFWLMSRQFKEQYCTPAPSGEHPPNTAGVLQRIWRVQKRLWIYTASVLLVFGLTLTVYPSLTSLVRPLTDIQPSVFVALQYVLFNVGDLIGRRVPAAVPPLTLRKRGLLVFALARLAYVPVLCAANVVKPSGTQQSSCRMCSGVLPDAAFMITVLTLGMTTGWAATSIMVGGPASIDDETDHVALEQQLEEDGELAEAEGLLDTPAPSGDASVAAMLLTLQLVTGLTLACG
ncbi:hypothetical protein MCUN1_003695 [Malassezia cuniculi]|uniref:Nucleoside transporter FUN26 n=1 Tax=Malassezia cuniculi TaxID=948313 RepID=A0AAF0EU18_9BASI|nr:hypothetical protein MCUN1_003695 [Malassezia cuniculi]